MDKENNKTWEKVASSRHQITSRLQVEGGWLYEVIRVRTGHIALQFVPSTTQETMKFPDATFTHHKND